MKTHILLVDDDKDELSFFLDALKDVPTDDGFKCTFASSAAEAREILQHLEPDFILVDYKMPDMNGLQFLLSIKNRLGSEKPKVFLYSIFVNDRIRIAAMNLGASGAIKKTTTIKSLGEELTAVLASPLLPAYAFSGGR